MAVEGLRQRSEEERELCAKKSSSDKRHVFIPGPIRDMMRRNHQNFLTFIVIFEHRDAPLRSQPLQLIRPKTARRFVLAVMAVAALMGYLLWSSYRDAVNLAQVTTLNMAWLLESRLDATLRRVDTVLTGQAVELQQTPAIMQLDQSSRFRREVERELDLRLGNFPEVAGLRVFDAEGRLLYTSGRQAGVGATDISDRRYFQTLKANGKQDRIYSEAITSKITHAPVFVAAMAVRDNQGRFLGLVTGAINLDHFAKLLGTINLGSHSTIAIRRSDDFSLMVRWPPMPNEINASLPPNHPNRKAIENGQKTATTDTEAHSDGVRRVFGLRTLDHYPFYVTVGVAHGDMLAGWYDRVKMALMASVLLFLLGYGLVRSLRRSERRLLEIHGELQKSDEELRSKEQRLRTVFDYAPVGHMVSRLEDGKFLKANQAFMDLVGYDREALMRLYEWNLTPARYAEEDKRQLQLLKETGRYGPYEKHYMHRDGTWVPVRLQGRLITAPDGEQLVLSVVENIAEQREAEERIRLMASVFQYSGEAILITDKHNRIIEVNPAFERMTGYQPEEVMGRNPKLLSSGRTTLNEYRDMWATINEQGHWQGELWDRHKDGHVYPKWITISTIRDNGGQVTHYIANFTDITEHKAAQERIQYIAHHDALTGLPNRLSLHSRLEQVLFSARRDLSRLAVMFIDLDRFKVINDTLGHHVGDDLLVEVAQRLKESVRESDIVSRLGGDEFVIVLTDVEVEDIAVVASKVLRNLSQAYSLEAAELHSTPSIGIAVYPEDGATAEALMKNADTAMYHAKQSGRNNYQFFRHEMNEAASERLMIENHLRQALLKHEFLLHYQPQIDTATGSVVGVEALIRWQHPQRGLIPPFKFIPIAEDSGLISPIGAWVLSESLRQLREWKDAGIEDLRMAVNLSANQLRDVSLPVRIERLLQQHGLRGEELELEITESVAMDDPAHCKGLMQQLHDLGVELAIDDFGTGYSSLAYLKQLPLDRLKLDRSFVTDIEHDPNDAAICTATISLAHSLNLAVVAEGVETETQLEYLKQLRCNLVQGYLFSRPLPADECLEFVRNNRAQRKEANGKREEMAAG